MATSFKREPKMMTTEPSADEVGGGMKRGGKAEKGETPKMHKAEMKEMGKIQKELKRHESMKAGKAHHGLKKGGMAPKAGPAIMGGLAGGIEATRPMATKKTGTIEGPGYKTGGITKKHHYAKGGQALAAKGDAFETKTTLKPKIDINDKVHQAKQTKGFNTKTGGVSDTTAGGKPAGYKKGGAIASKGMGIAKHYQTHINDGSKMPIVKGKTGDIKQRPAGYKDGGHIKTSTKSEHGFTHMKKMCSGGY